MSVSPHVQATHLGDATSDSRAPQDHSAGGWQAACVFVRSHRGCLLGDRCKYSHLAAPEAPMTRPRKQMRDLIKQRVLELFLEIPDDFFNLQDKLQEEAQCHPYAAGIILGYANGDILLSLGDVEIQSRWEPGVGFIVSV